MASCKKPVYKVEIKPITEKKRRRSDLVIMWQSIWDVSLFVLTKCWVISNHIWDTTKIWMKADGQREITTWLEKHLPAVPQDFTYSWRDGVLLSVLLNQLRPGCFPDAQNLETEYALRNVYRAFNVLEARFKIVPKMAAEEIVTCCNGSDQKLQDLLLQLKQQTDKEPHNETKLEDKCDGTVEQSLPAETASDACMVKGSGLLVGFVGREAFFVVSYTSLSELDLVVEIRGPGNELCCERITKRSPKRKQSVRNWKPSAPCLERSNSEKDSSPSLLGVMPNDEDDEKKTRRIPLKYEIRAKQVNFAYTPFTKGRHKVSILHQGQHISESPYVVTVEPQVGTYKSGDGCSLKPALKAPKASMKKESVLFQDSENKKTFGKVVKRRVLRYIVKIDKKDIVVDTDSIDQLASALLKMDYELQKRPLIRRNSWGFVGDAERKVSMIRQFCVDVDELEAQSLKMHRSLSLTISNKPKRAAFPKNASSYECEDILGRPSKLETVTEGKVSHPKDYSCREEEDSLAYLDEEFDCDKQNQDETKCGNAMVVSQLSKESPFRTGSLPFSWPTRGGSSASQKCEEKSEREQFHLESENVVEESSVSNDHLFLNTNAPNFSLVQSMEACSENDLNVERSKRKTSDEVKDVKISHQVSLEFEKARTDIEKPFTKRVINKLEASFVTDENSSAIHSPKLQEDEVNKTWFENFCFVNSYSKETLNNKEKKQSLSKKNLNSKEALVSSCCLNRRHRMCHYKTHKRRNNFKNCVVAPLNVVYVPVYEDGIYKRSTRSSEKVLKRYKSNNQRIHSPHFDQHFPNRFQYLLSTPTEALTAKYNGRDQGINVMQSTFLSERIDVSKTDSDSYVKDKLQSFHSKSFNTNKKETRKTRSDALELNPPFTWPNQNKKSEQNHSLSKFQPSSKETTKLFTIKTHPLASLGQFHFKHFNPVVENKKDGPVKLRVKQWQKKACDEPHVIKAVQKLDNFPEKGNLAAKLQFWESVQQKNEASCGESANAECRITVNQTLKNEKDNDYISEDCASIHFNIIKSDSSTKAPEPTHSKDNLCSPISDHKLFTEKPTDKLITIPLPTTRVRKRSFSDPGNFGTPCSEVSDLTETLPEPIRESLSSSSDANYLELSADDEISSVDLLYSTEDEYIDDEISDSASAYWGDLSFIKDLKLADASAYSEFCSFIESKYVKDRRDSSDSYPYECQVYGIANYFGHVAVKNRFRVLTNGAGCGNLSATVQGLGHHEVSFVSVEYVQKDVYEVTYQVLTPGLYLISVRWKETPITGSPFLCKVTF